MTGTKAALRLGPRVEGSAELVPAAASVENQSDICAASLVAPWNNFGAFEGEDWPPTKP
jgi:hypothetical protein